MDLVAVTANAVILNGSQIVAYSILPTGHSVKLIADKVVKEALKESEQANIDFDYVVSTGWGRHSVPFANKALSEIICHAKGAKFLIPSTRTIIDIGGQDSKIISHDESGGVVNFVMNDKCAAGTGRFLEVMANALDVALEEMGKISLMSQDPCSITSTCTVFAETEVVVLRGEEKARKDLKAGIHNCVTSRIYIG